MNSKVQVQINNKDVRTATASLVVIFRTHENTSSRWLHVESSLCCCFTSVAPQHQHHSNVTGGKRRRRSAMRVERRGHPEWVGSSPQSLHRKKREINSEKKHSSHLTQDIADEGLLLQFPLSARWHIETFRFLKQELEQAGWQRGQTWGSSDFFFSCFFVSRQDNQQVLCINGTINRLYLEINVSNTPTPGQPAEDAHDSILNISVPTMFIFSGFRTKAIKVKV